MSDGPLPVDVAAPTARGRGCGRFGCAVLILLGVLFVALLVGGVVIYRRVVDPRLEAVRPPDVIVRRYVDAILPDAGRDGPAYERALAQFCPRAQREFSAAQFRRFVDRQLDGIGPVQRSKVDEFPYPRGDNRIGIHFTLTGTVSSRGFQAYMRREGRFCIDEVTWDDD